MAAPVPQISNRAARRLFLARHALSERPTGRLNRAGLLDLVDRIGFVQVDSIRTVERAHDMILFARHQGFRRKDLAALVEKDRALFENWTHDASIIPTRFYPYWRLRFERERERLLTRFRAWRPDGFEHMLDEVLERVRADGPVMAREMGGDERKPGGGWWEWHPSKTALEFLWRTGALAVAGRDGFQKIYDLAERVIPAEHREPEIAHGELVDWACDAALDRLGFATSGELAAFFDIVTPEEAKRWCAENLGRRLVEVEIETADGGRPRRVFARPDIVEEAATAPEPPSRLRVLSPFDPMIRDRRRTERLFGYHYRIEVFVPAERRRFGYYVFPLLEGDRLVGRIDMKRQDCALAVERLWLEPGVRTSRGRLARLESELDRLRRFGGCERVTFNDGWYAGDGNG